MVPTVTLHEFLAPHLDMLVRRVDGPMAFRFIMQPTVAIILGIRAGLRDARAGRPAYFFWPAFLGLTRARELLRAAWTDVGKVFVIAFGLDVAYTLTVNRWVYPVQSLLVAASLALLPYLLVRGPATRIVRKARHR